MAPPPDKDFYQGLDPIEVPRYSVPEVAFLSGMSPGTLGSWIRGRKYPTADGDAFSPPIIARPVEGDPRLSFSNVFEAYALKAIRCTFGVEMAKVREALEYARGKYEIPRLLIHRDLLVAPGRLFLDQYSNLIDLTNAGQFGMRGVLERFLKRLVWDDKDKPRRFYPITRQDNPDSPTAVLIDPRISFGNPVVQPGFIRTAALADRWLAGETVEEIAQDYDLEPAVVDEALRHETQRQRKAA